MKKIVKSIFSSKWFYGISITFLGVILTAIFSYNLLISVLSYLKNILINIFGFVLLVLNFGIKVWIIFLVLMSFCILFEIFSFIWQKPDWLKYNKDILKKWIWRWNYIKFGKKYEILDMVPYCPECDCNLLNRKDFIDVIAYCPKCLTEYEGDEIENEKEIESLILRKINKEEYGDKS
ncbi:MAG: hypothetical protein NTX00_01370 [Candidatus Parcubacteria bacterium]|nr:hypothetical protein [Candidatus Parcubacteria bacterium]